MKILFSWGRKGTIFSLQNKWEENYLFRGSLESTIFSCMKSEKEIIFLWGWNGQFFSRKIRRNSYLIDPNWTKKNSKKRRRNSFLIDPALVGFIFLGERTLFFLCKLIFGCFFFPKENLVFNMTIIILVIWGWREEGRGKPKIENSQIAYIHTQFMAQTWRLALCTHYKAQVLWQKAHIHTGN